MTKLHTHCGCCSQCIDRRLAVFASDCTEHDPDEMYKTDVFVGQRSEKTQDSVLAESYVRSMRECADLTEVQSFGKYGEVTRAIPYFEGKSDEIAGKIFSLFKRNGEQVQLAIKNAVEYYSEDFGKGNLPDRCLFRQLFGTKTPDAIIKDVGEGRKKRRPTAKEMENRNRAVAMAAAKLKAKYDRLPTVDEIICETGYTRKEVYATDACKEGKIAKRSAKPTTEFTGSSIGETEYFSEKSIQHSRSDRRSRAEREELDALIDEQEKDDKSDRVL